MRNSDSRLFTSIILYSLVRDGPEEETLTLKSKKKVKTARKQAAPKQAQTRSKAARSNIAEGTRLFALADRPMKAQFIKLYGPNGPQVTRAWRAEAGVDAKHFQAALATKGWS
jgi:hypothetical protein